MNATDVKTKAGEYGADLVGIAAAGRFAAQPPERRPQSIAPECRAVIVVGRRILRGALRGVEEGTNFGSTYWHFGFTWLEDNFLAQTTYDLTCWIEAQGFEAVPLFAYRDEGLPKGRAVAPDRPAPNVHVDPDFAAQAAGLGEVGLCDVFLTRRYGPRQRFAMILTDADLEADPVSAKSVCGDCGACVSACPLGALDAAQRRRVGVPGHEMEVATVNYDVCRACQNGAARAGGRGSRPDRLAAACVRACVVQLEGKDKLDNRFAQPFRKRVPWAVDSLARPIDPAQAQNPAALGCGAAAVAVKRA